MPQDVLQLFEKMQGAQRPVIMVGGGGWTDLDRSTLQKCVSEANIPVITAFRYHDLFDNTDPLYLGEAGVGMTANTKRILREADVVLAVNLRFGEMTTDAFSLFGTEAHICCYLNSSSVDKNSSKGTSGLQNTAQSSLCE